MSYMDRYDVMKLFGNNSQDQTRVLMLCHCSEFCCDPLALTNYNIIMLHNHKKDDGEDGPPTRGGEAPGQEMPCMVRLNVTSEALPRL